MPELRVSPDKPALLIDVAAAANVLISHTLQTRLEVNLLLTGGSVGVPMLSLFDPDNDWDWSRIHLWWGDERWLPKGDAERNDQQAQDALIHRLPIPALNVHRMPAEDSGLSLDAAAQAYQDEMDNHFEGAAPRFDLTFLGVGPDAHVASLFPGLPGITERDRMVIPVRNSPKPPPERISLTLPALNSSERIWVVAAGADKAKAVAAAMAGPSENVPVSMVQGTYETLIFADRAAAG